MQLLIHQKSKQNLSYKTSESGKQLILLLRVNDLWSGGRASCQKVSGGAKSGRREAFPVQENKGGLWLTPVNNTTLCVHTFA